jgi:hypothetical protein
MVMAGIMGGVAMRLHAELLKGMLRIGSLGLVGGLSSLCQR